MVQPLAGISFAFYLQASSTCTGEITMKVTCELTRGDIYLL